MGKMRRAGQRLAALLLILPLTAQCFEMYDMMPDIDAISFDGSDVLFGDSIRLPEGDLSRWPDSAYQVRSSDKTKQNSCAVPDISLPIPQYVRLHALACSVEYIWIAAEAYCSEGLDDSTPLFRVARADNTFERFDWVPECAQPTALVETVGSVWIGTSSPIEKYRDQSAFGVIRVTRSDERTDLESFFSGLTVTALNAAENTVWAVGNEGVGKLDLRTGQSVLRYFDFVISEDDEVRSVLVDQPPHPDRAVLFVFLKAIPITAKQAFISQLTEAKQNGNYSVDHPPKSMLPFYIKAARAFELEGEDSERDWGNDWHFSYLINLVMRYRSDYPAEVKSLLHDLQAQRHSEGRRKVIMEALSGLDDPDYRPDSTSAFVL